ncbi:integral membrane protein-like protein [Phyllosticta citribraziliensis]|uniref:Integral membrane protein-like protein n=1 Tax=Phyllosticta citribraziliensis TaxID=989973 RepID=A0ABR1LAN3_9PEZI
MASKAVVPFLVSMMLLTGVCNTLLTKFQDQQCVRNCDSKHPEYFEQPVIQTLQMFIGEMGCWLVVGGFALYQSYFAKRRAAESGGYEPVPRSSVDNNDNEGPGTAETEAEETPDSGSTEVEEGEVANPLKLVPSHASDGHNRVPLTGWKVTYLALPAVCDIAGTTLMNVGLLFVAASIYQMTRGALVLFVGLFSVLFLKRYLRLYKWAALVIVVLGVMLVGLAGAISKDDKASHGSSVDAGEEEPIAAPLAVRTIIGVLLIAGAQIFTATQFVLEESIMENYELEPLKVVGWEGIFGFSVTVLCMVILHFAVGQTPAGRYGYFDAKEGLREITHFPAVAISSILIMISIGGFNFFGLSVTRTVSATSRATIDTCRTLFIWIVSLGLGWETFKWLQVAGFALLVYGTFLFNDIVRPPLQAWLDWRGKDGKGKDRRGSVGGVDELLPEGPIEHV